MDKEKEGKINQTWDPYYWFGHDTFDMGQNFPSYFVGKEQK